VEGVVVNLSFWRGKRVLITGHTGFKGGWLALWLQHVGAEVVGYSMAPPSEPNLFGAARVAESMISLSGDVRDPVTLQQTFAERRPEIVFHLAAQALVRTSYADPLDTYSTNVMGTANLLEAVRGAGGVRAVVIVTSDKCYENREWSWGYRERDRLGGHDPYSNSKACAELVTAAYRDSFFPAGDYHRHGVALASARAGNVIGGGDWATDRLIPDAIRALASDQPLQVRSPSAVRPWQHVLEPLSGYLLLAQSLWVSGTRFAGPWNFGPEETDAQPVGAVLDRLMQLWGHAAPPWQRAVASNLHEASCLKLDCALARNELGWRPTWNLQSGLAAVVEWHHAFRGGANMRQFTLDQIQQFVAASQLAEAAGAGAAV